MKTLHIGVFNPKLIMQASPYCGDNVFYKGFIDNGYKAFYFDYRANQNPNDALINYAKEIEPDLFWFGKCENIYSGTIERLREIFPKSIFCKWGADVRDMPTANDLGHNQYIDFFFATYGGNYLKAHLTPNMKAVCSMITFTDSEYYKKEIVNDEYVTDILWTGRFGFGDNVVRNEVIEQLKKYKEIPDIYNIRLFGITEQWIGNPDYVRYINGARIGIGANSFNRRKYSSDRLGNYMSCGAFYLCHYFEGIEECFKRGIHLDWFHDINEFKNKLDYYLMHDDIRNNVAMSGQQHVLAHFDTKPLVSNILNVIKTGKSTYAWDDVYTN